MARNNLNAKMHAHTPDGCMERSKESIIVLHSMPEYIKLDPNGLKAN